MTKPIDLDQLVEEMDMQFEDFRTFVNKESGQFVTISSDNLRDIEDGEILPPYDDYQDWEKEELEECEAIIDCYNEDYIPIPSKFHIHEYSIMEEFCLAIDDEKLSDELYSAIKGSGAFRRFKDLIQRYDIADDWYKYRDNKYREIAIEWCEENDIEYK